MISIHRVAHNVNVVRVKYDIGFGVYPKNAAL